MARLILIFLLIPLMGLAQKPLNQTDSLGMKQGFWQRHHPNGQMMYEGNFLDDKPTGEWKRYHDNGVLQAILQHRSTNDTVKAILFDRLANRIAEGNYTGTLKNGMWQFFNNGVLHREEAYKDDRKHGVSRVYYPNGVLLEESEWQNNLLHGRYSAYYPGGILFLECQYSNNERNGICITYSSNGLMEIDAHYSHDLPHGEWTFYTENGSVRYKLNYQEGILQNPEVLYEAQTKQLDAMENQRHRLADPAHFLNDPMEYLLRQP